MNKIVTLPQLAESIGAQTSITNAESLLRTIFDTVASTLGQGESVTIAGIGTFSPSDNPDLPLEWIPDVTLADEVNEPFAAYSPEVLADGISEQELSEGIEPELISEPEIDADSVPETDSNFPPISSHESVRTQTQQPEPTPESLSEQEPEPSGESESIDSTPVTPQPIVPPIITAPVKKPLHIPQLPTSASTPQPIMPPLPSQSAGKPHHKHNLWWLYLLLGLITGCVVGYYIASSQQFPFSLSDVIQTKSIAITDSASTVDDTIIASSVDTLTSVAQPDTTTSSPTFEPLAIETVRPGYYLTSMARKHYGDYHFWIYIYEENSDVIHDPDRVSPGTRIVIPAPGKYGIDASSMESKHLAQKKIDELNARLAK